MVASNKAGAKASSKIQNTVVRRSSNKIYAVFVDGIGLDRACRRIDKKIDLTALLKSLTAGLPAAVARYYTLLPKEDDSRHRSYLDAVSRAGFDVFSKRLPPKGIERQISTDAEMSADMIAFACNRSDMNEVNLVSASGQFSIMNKFDPQQTKAPSLVSPHPAQKLEDLADLKLEQNQEISESEQSMQDLKKVIVVVCPSRDLAYPFALCNHFGADTISADFGKFATGDVLKSANKWIDLSDSQTIWKN